VRRRDVLKLLGATAAWPRTLRAQQRDRMRRIGVILSGAENDPEMQARLGALRQGLQALGWIEGRNFRFEPRWPASNGERVRTAAAELIDLAPDLVVVGTYPAARAMQRESPATPVVFVNLADPIGGGLIPSLTGSGRNITGFTAFEYKTAGKWLELLKEIAPRVTRVAVVFGGKDLGPSGEGFYGALVEAAPAMSLQLVPVLVSSPRADIEPAITEFAAKPGGGLIAVADAGGTITRSTSIRLAAQHRLPAVYPFRYYAAEGGLAVYGVDLLDQYRRAAGYVDRILKGALPADLPVQAPDRFELVINLKTARELGIDIPPTLLARADEVLE
jgi:putative ABC transport system substrate-binding protein